MIWTIFLDKTEIEKLFAQINKDKEYIIARYLKENVLGDNDQIKKDIIFKIHQFYDLPARISPNFINSDLVSTIGKFANEYYKNKLEKEYLASDEREEEFEEYMEILSSALNNAINDFDYLDTSLEFAEDSMRVLGFLCDTRWSEKNIKMQAEKISDVLYSYVSSTFNKNIGNCENTILYDNFEQDALPKITEMKPDFKSHSYFGYNEIIDASNREYINQIPTVQNIRLPYYTFIKEQAIKANFEYVPVPESIIRNLTNEEVNSIIDRDYKKIDGKYQYSEASNSKSSIWFTREEIISLISKKYFYVRVVFKAHVDFEWGKTLCVKKNK